jgi:hypothetical protein
MFSQLEALDYADDLAESSTGQHLQDKTASVNVYAVHIGLKINTAKTKVMVINTKLTDPSIINDHQGQPRRDS